MVKFESNNVNQHSCDVNELQNIWNDGKGWRSLASLANKIDPNIASLSVFDGIIPVIIFNGFRNVLTNYIIEHSNIQNPDSAFCRHVEKMAINSDYKNDPDGAKLKKTSDHVKYMGEILTKILDAFCQSNRFKEAFEEFCHKNILDNYLSEEGEIENRLIIMNLEISDHLKEYIYSSRMNMSVYVPIISKLSASSVRSAT